jgi:hypothetical protein
MLLERTTYGFGALSGCMHLHIAGQVVYRISNAELVAKLHNVCVPSRDENE